MRLLLDENVGIEKWAQLLRAHGHDVARVVDVGLQGVSDAEVIAYACEKGRALVSRDKAASGPDDLVAVWKALPSPRPSLLIIYPGAIVTVEDIVRAVANIEAQGLGVDELCAVNAWRY